VATHSQAPCPPTRQPVSSITTAGLSLMRRTISACTGTKAVPVVCAAPHKAPAVTSIPRRASSAAHLANDNPSP
jgi:hypothetical protein